MIHLKSLEPPEPSSTPDTVTDVPQPEGTTPASSSDRTPVPEVTENASAPMQEDRLWSEDFTAVLGKFLSPLVMDKLKQMYEEGPEPPFVSDSGWGGRQVKQEESEIPDGPPAETTSKRGRGRGRGGRGGRGRDRNAHAGRREDGRRVITDVCTFSFRIHTTKLGT